MTTETPPAHAPTRRAHDVAIVGLGPVGQTLAILLAQRGHSVVVVEKQPRPYPLPRAVHYDGDVSRLLDGLGIADFQHEFASPTTVYEWQNASRQTMLRFTFPLDGSQGWPESSMFNQPALEERLRQRGEDFENILVYRGTEAVGITQTEEDVEVRVTSPTLKQRVLRAKYLVGCDGANSFVRQYMETSVTDLGFFHQWLIVDIRPHQESQWDPDNLQVCDPARPTSFVNGGPGRRRFEFMRMPGDHLETFNTDESAWALLAPWGFTPENCDLERRAIYTFQARWANTWRDGRILLAGDAAHQMPPFFGQGMVSGMRDAANLAWKLDLVLAGLADRVLLDTYSTERGAHVQHAIGMSIELGRVICQTDPDAVAARDAHFLAQGPDPALALPPVPPERLGPGAFPDGDPARHDGAGLLGPQGRVRHSDGQAELFDRRGFGTFAVICDGSAIGPSQAQALAAALPPGLPAAVVRMLPADAEPDRPQGSVYTMADLDGRYLPWLAGRAGAIVRPDFYVFGIAADTVDLAGLIAELAPALSLAPTPIPLEAP